MLTYLGFVSSSSLVTNAGRTLRTSNRIGLDSSEKGSRWYFIHFPDLPNITKLKADGIPLKHKDIISPTWFRCFMDLDAVILLKSKYKADVVKVLPEQKIIGRHPSNEVSTLMAIVHPSFDYTSPLLAGVNVSKVAKNAYKVITNNGEKTSQILSKFDSVLGISEADFRVELLNRFESGRIQKAVPPVLDDGIWGGYRYFNKKGITGKNITAMVVDSGLDISSVYFGRKGELVYGNKLNNHSKIAYYDKTYGYLDKKGHGTHVSGILAGKAVSEDPLDSVYNGVAYDARLATVHIEATTGKTPLTEHMVKIARESKSTISSNSFGFFAEDEYYTKKMLNDIDEMAYKNQDITFIFAAGNTGPDELSIYNFASAKNMITVANAQVSYNEGSVPFNYLICDNKKLRAPASKQFKSYYKKSDPTIKGVLKKYNGNNPEEEIIIIDSDFRNNINNVSDQVRGVIYTGGKEEELVNFPGRDIPIFCVSENMDDLIGKEITIQPAHDEERESIKITRTSSRGVTHDGIKKPDLATVGTFIMSPMPLPGGERHNNMAMDSGTSMATPAVSGAACLIADYFINFKKANHPSANTIKAILYASCDPIAKREFNEDVGTEGHGEVSLYNVLNMDNFEDKRMWLSEDTTIKRNDYLTAKVKVVKKMGKLRFAMGYTDKPLNEETIAMIALDVNLFVESPSGKRYWGNGEEERAMLMEKVIIDEGDVEEGEYTVHLVCNGLMDGITVNTSVVVIGALGQDKSFLFQRESSKCIEDCNMNGECNNGICKCRAGFYGSSCQFQTDLISEQTDSKDLDFNSLQISVLEIPIGDNVKDLQFTVDGDDSATRPNLVLFSGRRPTFLWDVDALRKFTSHTSMQLFPSDEILAKAGDSVFVTLYNMNQRKQKFKVRISSKIDTGDDKPSSLSSEISSNEQSEAPDTNLISNGTNSDENAPDSKSENDQQKEGRLTKGATIAISAIAPLVVIAAVVISLVVVCRRKQPQVESECDIEI